MFSSRDGKLFLQVPNADCWQFLLLGSNWSGLDVPRHLIHFRAEDLEHLLDDCGFQVVRRRFFSLRDNPAGLATSLCPQLEPVSRRVRKVKESNTTRLLKDLLYLATRVGRCAFHLARGSVRGRIDDHRGGRAKRGGVSASGALRPVSSVVP